MRCNVLRPRHGVLVPRECRVSSHIRHSPSVRRCTEWCTVVYIPWRRERGSMESHYDVVVVGAGNAALCAAIAAREAGAAVLVLERAPYAERGGNTAFTAGAMRVVYGESRTFSSSARISLMICFKERTSGCTPRRSSSTTCARVPSTAPIRNWRNSSCRAASTRCAGCATRECVCCQSTAGRRSR